MKWVKIGFVYSIGCTASTAAFMAPGSIGVSSALKSTAEATTTRGVLADYTEDELKAALNSLLDGSEDPSFDGRHIFGFNDPEHKLSKLQSITATRILDYNKFLVRLQLGYFVLLKFGLVTDVQRPPFLGLGMKSYFTKTSSPNSRTNFGSANVWL